MEDLTEKQAISLLKKFSKDKESFKKVLDHSKTVRKIALGIAKYVKGVDKKFISIGSLLHDIGRFECFNKDPVKHGICGAKILRKLGLNRYALVAERHLGAGISKKEVKEQRLDIPVKDYVPVTKEEKIITHADNLTKGSKRITLKEAIRRYEKEIGKKAADKVRKLADEIEKMKLAKD